MTLPWTYTGLHAWYLVTVRLDAFVTHNGVTTLLTPPLVNAGPTSCCTTPSNGFSYSGTATFDLQAGDTYGFKMSGSNDDLNSFLRGTLTVGSVVNDSWPFATNIDLDSNGDGTASDSIDGSGQARWYRFTIAPGEDVKVDLTGLAANYDVALFSDISQAFNSLNSVGDLQHLSAEFAPSVFQPSVFQPSVFQPSVFQPSVFQPSVFQPSVFQPSVFQPSVFQPSVFQPSVFQPSVFQPSTFADANGTYESAQTRSLVAVSAADGTADEHIVANTWNNTFSFYVRVSGRNGAYAPGQPFALHVHVDQGSCANVVPSTAPLLSDSSLPVPTGVKTLILADFERMPEAGRSDMEDDLDAFAKRPEIGGAIVELGTQSPRVTELFQQADTNLACPYAEDLVAGSIRDIVQAYRDANPGLRYIVLVGDDHDVPFFRYPDAAGLASESNYVPPVADDSASQASLRLDYVLSQDAYGAKTILHLNGLDVPVPDLPVGRLVETPTDITRVLDAYTTGTTNGVVPTPTSSLVTGYDFIQGSADSVEADLSTGLGAGATNDQLITKQGTSPSDTGTPPDHSWTADQLRTALLGRRHDLIYLGGHFSADNALAADYATAVDSTELAASDVDLKNAIVFSPGCHSGYNIVDGDSLSGVTQPLDWVQAFARKGATLIAGTGYQYGDTDFLAYSLRLYADFAHALRAGTGPVDVGAALVAAKQQYLGDTQQLSGIDVKSFLEATLYGLPMLGVDMPAGRVSPPAPNPQPTVQAFETNPGSTLGLGFVDREYKPTLTEQSSPLNSGNVTATYVQGPDGVVTAPGEPALPLEADDVTVDNEVLRGVGFLGGTFTDKTGITPLVGAPTTDLNAAHGPFASPTFFPERPWSINYFAGLANGTTATRLLVTPAQYRSDSADSLTDLQRTFSQLDLRLFYSGNTQVYGQSVPALAAAPVISRVDAGGDGHVEAHVVGNPAAGIQQVWVTYATPLGPDSGTWQSVFLTQDAQDSTLWSGTIPVPGPVQFMVQAVNGVGLVALDDNVGAFYTAGAIPPALASSQTTATTLQLSAPADGPFGSQAAVSATLAGPSVPEQVTFTIGSSTRTVTTSNGVASTSLPLLAAPGSYSVTASFSGDSSFRASSASASLTISKLGTALALEPASAAARAGADTGVSATLTSGSAGLAQRTVAFVLTPASGPSITQARITDLDGKASLGVVPQLPAGLYSVQAFFAGGAPITLPADPVYESASSGTSQLLVDATPPTITFNGNRGTYSVLDQVNITCTATDGGSGSGLRANPCSTFSINQPAWSFQPGTNTVPTPGLVATDNVGNSSAPAQTTFTVAVTPTTLCQLTRQFAQTSPKYARLTAKQKLAVDALTGALCSTLDKIVPRLNPLQKTILVAAYKKGVDDLAAAGWLTGNQAATLKKFVAAL